MKPIYIPQLLKMPLQTEEFKLNQAIANLETLTPVKGILTVTHGGTFLEVKVLADTIITLTCDRCLQSFNYRLSVDTSELIFLDKKLESDQHIPLEREITSENLSESLDPNGYFEVENWLYEQLSLAMPLRQLCQNNCSPPEFDNTPVTMIDSRWRNLASLISEES